MRIRSHSALALALGSALLLAFTSAVDAAPTSSKKPTTVQKTQISRPAAATRPVISSARASHAVRVSPTKKTAQRGSVTRGKKVQGRVYAGRSGGISCVPYARSVTGMNVSGNAWQWWGNAEGSYARGQMPEAGSVLAFRNNMRMPMGHVAVVSRVESPRVVTIDHANWPVGGRRGAVSRGVAVVDVSERNDWSAVRVSLGGGADFGSIYPTHGFIYNRPDTSGTIRVTNRAPAPMLALNSPPRDLRSGADRSNAARYADRAYVEVAEAPAARSTFNAETQRFTVTLPSAPFNGGN
jgi:surface antigen